MGRAGLSSWTESSSTGATEGQARSAEPRRNRIGISQAIVDVVEAIRTGAPLPTQ